MSSKTTRTTLIRSMLRLVREKRFSAITVEEVCARSSVSRRTFYRYYTDKYGLLRDVYLECFFSKIAIDDQDDFWDIFCKICQQIASDKMFFRHAFEVKEQNGFWDESKTILTPFFMREAPSYDFVDEIKEYFVQTDLDRLFHLTELWIDSGMKASAEEFSNWIRASYYIYGLWTSQLAGRLDRSTFTSDVYKDFDAYLEEQKKPNNTNV